VSGGLEPEQVLHADDPVVQQVLELLAAGDISTEELQTLPKHVLRQLLAMSGGAAGGAVEPAAEAAGTTSCSSRQSAGGKQGGKAVGGKKKSAAAVAPQLPDDPWDD
jgi:hypothetical protein